MTPITDHSHRRILQYWGTTRFYERIQSLPFVFLLCTATFSVLSCGNNTVSGLYGTLANGKESGAVLVQSGETKIHLSDALYARDNFSVITGKQLAELPDNAKRLALTGLMIRRMAIQDGISSGIYDSDEARTFILPRFEKILEEYYYFKLSKEEVWATRLRSISHDRQALQAFLSDDPVLKSRRLSEHELSSAISSTVERIIEQKRIEENSRVKQELLKANPPIRIMQ